MRTRRRWSVETKPDVFEVAFGASVTFEGGVLILMDEDDDLSVAYAAGCWITVTPDAAGAA